MLTEGFTIRYIDDLEGHHQIVAFHVPGDFVDLHGYPLQILDHSRHADAGHNCDRAARGVEAIDRSGR